MCKFVQGLSGSNWDAIASLRLDGSCQVGRLLLCLQHESVLVPVYNSVQDVRRALEFLTCRMLRLMLQIFPDPIRTAPKTSQRWLHASALTFSLRLTTCPPKFNSTPKQNKARQAPEKLQGQPTCINIRAPQGQDNGWQYDDLLRYEKGHPHFVEHGAKGVMQTYMARRASIYFKQHTLVQNISQRGDQPHTFKKLFDIFARSSPFKYRVTETFFNTNRFQPLFPMPTTGGYLVIKIHRRDDLLWLLAAA